MKYYYEIVSIGNRTIVIKGVARSFYEGGFPISISMEEFSKRGIEVSLLHLAEQCWENGWSTETILKKLKGECDLDINKVMGAIHWETLEKFCNCLEQPKRANGGYEESREMIFQYLFGMASNEAKQDVNSFVEVYMDSNIPKKIT